MVTVNDKRHRKQVSFGSLSVGDTFLYDDCVFIKLASVEAIIQDSIFRNAVSINGTLFQFDPLCGVELVDLEVSIVDHL